MIDWVDFGVQTAAAGVALYIGRLIGRREERRKVPAPAAVVEPPAPPEVRTYTVEVGKLEAFNVRAKSEAQAVDDAVGEMAVRLGGGPGRFIALRGGCWTLVVRAIEVDNNPATETP